MGGGAARSARGVAGGESGGGSVKSSASHGTMGVIIEAARHDEESPNDSGSAGHGCDVGDSFGGGADNGIGMDEDDGKGVNGKGNGSRKHGNDGDKANDVDGAISKDVAVTGGGECDRGEMCAGGSETKVDGGGQGKAGSRADDSTKSDDVGKPTRILSLFSSSRITAVGAGKEGGREKKSIFASSKKTVGKKDADKVRPAAVAAAAAAAAAVVESEVTDKKSQTASASRVKRGDTTPVRAASGSRTPQSTTVRCLVKACFCCTLFR